MYELKYDYFLECLSSVQLSKIAFANDNVCYILEDFGHFRIGVHFKLTYLGPKEISHPCFCFSPRVRSNNKDTMYWDSLYYALNVVELKVGAFTLNICI